MDGQDQYGSLGQDSPSAPYSSVDTVYALLYSSTGFDDIIFRSMNVLVAVDLDIVATLLYIAACSTILSEPSSCVISLR